MSTTTALKKTSTTQLLSNEVLGMLIFVFTEAMFFTGLLSACIVIKGSNRFSWIPPETIKLPMATTGFNTFVLFISGLLAIIATISFNKNKTDRTFSLLVGAFITGSFFVGFQTVEWVRLLKYGMSMEANIFSACFFLLIGAHGLHALSGLIVLGLCIHRLRKNTLTGPGLHASVIFWSLIVVLWPFYLRVHVLLMKALLSFFIVIFIPVALWACPVCGFGQDGTEAGFIITTIILTFLPLALFGSIIYFLIKKNKELNNES